MTSIFLSPQRFSIRCTGLGMLLFFWPGGCLADTLNPIPRPKDGRIVERCDEVSQVSISLTDKSGAEIGVGTITVNCNLPSVTGFFNTES
jgi:hypothetical protein